ncbi:hypothetical protein KKB64_04965 [Patescibacteria group bacterium]|nr:hypothetical protein [Patescibacteria group bacterium]MBU2459638.1 hypothetical protein [Patescibacteria group bacterium]MBU2544459.1 hypothetical protein [Patescibacteria group bacterium]
MRHKKRDFWWLMLGIINLTGFVSFVNFIAPGKTIYLVIFFVLIFLSTVFLSFYVLNNVRRGLLIACGVVVFLFLRLWGLYEPMYLGLLIASLLSLELVFRNS